jgi:hypothetical protein
VAPLPDVGCPDADKDGALCDSELDALAVQLNGAPFPAADKADLRDNFDVTKDGYTRAPGHRGRGAA